MSVLVEGLSDEEREHAGAALAACAELEIAAGQSRVASRVPAATALLVVEDGIVLVTRERQGASRRMVVAVAGPGALLLPPVVGERLEALADARLTAVTADTQRELLRLPDVAARILEGLAEELRDRHESLAQFSNVRHVERVRDKLLQLARTHGKVAPGGVRLDLPLTHELVGEMVGSARETVTWAFAQLAREGFVAREGRGYRLAISPASLAS